MKKTLDVFCEIPCLTEQSKQLGGIALQKKWFKNADKRFIGQFLHKFVNYNSEQFKFLGVQPYINIGLDLFEFLHNANIVKTVIEHSDTNVNIDEFTSMFNNVCTNGEEIAKKFIALLLFFELASITNNVIDTSRFVYACNLASVANNE